MLTRRRCGLLLVIMLFTGVELWAAARYAVPQSLGALVVTSSVWVNGKPAFSGTTVFPGDVVETGKDSNARVGFKSGAFANLLSNSEIALPLAVGPAAVTLRRGVVEIGGARQGWTQVSVLGSPIYLRGEGQFPALCRVAAVGRGAAVLNERGHVEIWKGGAPVILAPGKMVKWEAGGPQGSGQVAGSVSAAIPAETVQRKGQTQALPLKVQDPIIWEDTVTTEKTGRVRIALQDGSFINVGARSVFRVDYHQPSTQQTVIDLTVGKMRGEVVKLTKPGASFQVRTQTAVIGVVGTVFLITATANLTRVHCIEGLVSVTNINPAIGGTVTLGAGQMTSVPRGLPPTGAVSSPSGQVNTTMNQTNIGGPTAGPGGAGGVGGGGAPPAGAAAGAANTAANAASAAANATSAGLAGGAVAGIGAATTSLGSASSSLSTATSTNNTTATTSNDATQAANGAAAASNSATTAINTIIQNVISPSTPCGCE